MTHETAVKYFRPAAPKQHFFFFIPLTSAQTRGPRLLNGKTADSTLVGRAKHFLSPRRRRPLPISRLQRINLCIFHWGRFARVAARRCTASGEDAALIFITCVCVLRNRGTEKVNGWHIICSPRKIVIELTPQGEKLNSKRTKGAISVCSWWRLNRRFEATCFIKKRKSISRLQYLPVCCCRETQSFNSGS